MELSTLDIARLKITIDSLKQDNESLKFSLESSERLRVQQKELIHMLQKSQALRGDHNSMASFRSISSISHKGEGEGDSELSSALPIYPENANAENKSWLNMNTHISAGTPAPSSSRMLHTPTAVSSSSKKKTGSSKSQPKLSAKSSALKSMAPNSSRKHTPQKKPSTPSNYHSTTPTPT
ncbi:hypothetical protein EON65_52250, partial [archaeon]